MLTYSRDPQASTALYDQLYRAIREDILAGRLTANSRLPSKRSLAQHLKISVVTVETAYGQLIAEGYVYAREKSGYFVSPVDRPGIRPALPAPSLPEETKENWILDLRANRMDPSCFPFSVWSKITRNVLSRQDVSLLEPVPYNGIYELRRALSDYLHRFRGIDVDPGQIVIGAGTEYLYSLLIQLLGRDKRYGVENPGYPKIRRIYNANGVDNVGISLDEEGISIPALRSSGAQILHLSPSHHFPTGIVTPIGRRQELLHWAQERPDRYIIEDDYDSEFRFTGKPIPTMQSIDHGHRVVYINSFSKTIAPSIRISYLILPPLLAERFHREFSFYSCTVSSFEQYTLADFISGGYFERHISRMKKLYRERRNAIIQAILESPLAPYVTILEKDAGLHFLLQLSLDVPEETVRAACKQRGFRLGFLSDYTDGSMTAAPNTLVINYSGIDPEQFRRVLEHLTETRNLKMEDGKLLLK